MAYSKVVSRLSSRLHPSLAPSLSAASPKTTSSPVSGLSLLKSSIHFPAAPAPVRRTVRISRLPLELSCVESMMPLHSAIASAWLISSLPIASQSWELVPQGRSLKDHIKGRDRRKIMQEKPEAAGNDSPKMIRQEPESESIIKELLPAIPFFDEDSEALGDDPSAKIMQEKTKAAGETDKKPLSKCLLCGKITHHNFWDCPDRVRVRKMHPYCKVCNEGGHDHSDCAKATEDVLKKLRFCFICDKNTDHDTDDCSIDSAFVLINGVKIPNFCDLCRVVGHRGKECYLNSYDLQYGLDDPSMDF